MYELTRHTYSRHEVNTHVHEDQHRKSLKSDKAILFDQQKGHDLQSSDLNLDYWYEMSDRTASEDDPNPDSRGEEVMMDYYSTTDNWSSDDEETLQIHPETIKVPSLASRKNWGDRHDGSVTLDHTLLDIAEDDFTICDSIDHQLVYIKDCKVC